MFRVAPHANSHQPRSFRPPRRARTDSSAKNLRERPREKTASGRELTRGDGGGRGVGGPIRRGPAHPQAPPAGRHRTPPDRPKRQDAELCSLGAGGDSALPNRRARAPNSDVRRGHCRRLPAAKRRWPSRRAEGRRAGKAPLPADRAFKMSAVLNRPRISSRPGSPGDCALPCAQRRARRRALPAGGGWTRAAGRAETRLSVRISKRAPPTLTTTPPCRGSPWPGRRPSRSLRVAVRSRAVWAHLSRAPSTQTVSEGGREGGRDREREREREKEETREKEREKERERKRER